MKNEEIIRYLSDAYEWIEVVINGEEKEQHIIDMLDAIEQAMEKLKTDI
jgi:ATP:corrinoid adenosyltransferase